MRILALGLNKSSTAASTLDRKAQEQRHTTVRTTPMALHDLVVAVQPRWVVIEFCPLAGWLSDLMWGLGIELQVVDVAHDAWRWRRCRIIFYLTDRRLGKASHPGFLGSSSHFQEPRELSLVDQLSRVHVWDRATRQWHR